MVRSLIIAAALAGAVTTLPRAHAQDEAQVPTITQCGEILAGLMTLSDGYYATDKDGKAIIGQDGKAVKVPYKLGKLRLPIAADITLLRGVLKDAEEARVAMVKEMIPDMPDVGPDPLSPSEEYRRYTRSDKYKKFDEAYKAMMSSGPVGARLTLARIKEADLKIGDDPGQNPVPPIALSQLEPILDR